MPWRAGLVLCILALLGCGGSEGTGGGWEGIASGAGEADAGAGNHWPKGTSDPPSDLDAGKDDAEPGPSQVLCTGRTGGKGDRLVTVNVGGRDREFLLHVPPSYNATKGTALVTSFHGFTMSASVQSTISQMQTVSDARGFLVAFPSGIGSSWNAGDCCGQAIATGEDDIGFFKALLAYIEASYCIDPKQVFVTGFSNGAFFAHTLACEMANVVAAIAPVSGVLGMSPAKCAPSRPISVLEFHGTRDIVVPYEGGGLTIFRSVEETNEAWRAKNTCTGAGSIVYQQGDATCSQYKCAEGTEVELCTIDGGGHTWPGGEPTGIPGEGKLSKSIKASERIADFFARHPMP